MNKEDSEKEFSSIKVYGGLLVGLAAISLAPILVRFAADYSSLLVATIRTVLATLFLLPIYLFKKKKGALIEASSNKEHILVAAAGISLGFHFIAWISSIYYTSIASASVLVCMHPIILIIAERVWLKVNFRLVVWFGVLVSFVGTLMLGFIDVGGQNNFPNAVLGNILAVLAALIFAVYFLIGRQIRQKRSWLGYVFPVYSYAAITCIVVLISVEGFSFEVDSTVLLIGLLLAIGPQLLGHGSLNYAVKYVSPTLLSTLILAEPILASIVGFFVFQELPKKMSLLAMMIILIGISMTWKRKEIKSIES